MKVLHLPSNAGGNAWGLAVAERALGLQSEVLILHQGWLHYPADIDLEITKYGRLGKHLKPLKAFFEIRNKYDIFHFNFGSSLSHYYFSGPYNPLVGAVKNHLELPFYPSKAKKFVTYNGCDARQKYRTMERTSIASCHEPNCYEGVCNSGDWDKFRKRAIDKMALYVDHMWALNPDLLYFLPKEKSSFLPYTVSSLEAESAPLLPGKKLVIVHAPTNRAGKGSKYILEALDRIQAKYPQHIEVRLVEKVPHEQALEIYRSADLVIDQILIGWYGAFAVEVMQMGKPVIARIAEEDLKFIPPDMARDLCETVINADPFTIYDVLERCIQDRAFLKQRGEAGREYALRWHDPSYIAKLTKEKYES